MATATWTQIRDQAKKAIYAILQQNVESVTVNGTTYKRHDLAKLMQLVKDAERRIDNETKDRRPGVVAFRRPG